VKSAVLLLAHGTPDSAEQVPEYLEAVTRGRALPREVVEEIRHRYQQIGHSPLTEITLAQARALETKLGKTRVYAGMRNWRPWIKDVAEQMLADGVERAVVICLAPQNSRTSVGLYREAVEKASQGKLALEFVEDWHEHPLLIAAFAEKLTAARGIAPVGTPVLFTAHSVPCRTIQSAQNPSGAAAAAGDPYSQQCKQTAALVAARAGLREDDWFFAFQSQGMSGGPWISPTVEQAIEGLSATGNRTVLVQSVGFLCDHVEVLYDIDIAFEAFAAERGMELMRAESLNTSGSLVDALEQIARERLTRVVEVTASR